MTLSSFIVEYYFKNLQAILHHNKCMKAILGSAMNFTSVSGTTLGVDVPEFVPNTFTLLAMSGALKEAWGAEEEKVVSILLRRAITGNRVLFWHASTDIKAQSAHYIRLPAVQTCVGIKYKRASQLPSLQQ
eukprot:1142016-Pelagomonas_calceolata.AAC.3